MPCSKTGGFSNTEESSSKTEEFFDLPASSTSPAGAASATSGADAAGAASSITYAMLYYTILCYAMLYYTTLYYTILAWDYSILYMSGADAAVAASSITYDTPGTRFPLEIPVFSVREHPSPLQDSR